MAGLPKKVLDIAYIRSQEFKEELKHIKKMLRKS